MLDQKFFGREPIQRAECPFCGLPIEKPKELNTRKPGEMPVGMCSCGAVYACDETGHNLGAALIEALLFGCNMDWDLAWGLVADEDYKQEIVENYDFTTHLVIPSGTYEGRKTGALYFIRLHQEVQEVTAQGARNRLASAAPENPKTWVKHSSAKRMSKKEVEKKVKAYQIDPILDAVRDDKKIIRYLQRLLYSGDNLLRHRAAEALGSACAVVGDRDPGIVSKLLQGLFYSLTDTAAFPLGAFEAIGEIIAQRPDLYGGYTSQLYQFTGDVNRRVDALKALGRISITQGPFIRKHTLYFFAFLEDPDPMVRGYTVWLMGNLGAHEARKDIEKCLGESHALEIYETGNIRIMPVSEIAKEALNKL
ncbi:MAG: HEAT repeat domain-containing protein [Deltaproteobacteria bacterium]|nr:HEAT repeat domain-containing protein [Deltaproteobacteria bacterium]